jgi:(1->4)-alpha-D-glucan 1-alpha-D-glucosylmutase
MAAPTPNDEYLLYQTIVGTWPMRISQLTRPGAALADYLDRLKAYAIKACREAKLVSSWTMPNTAYEEGLTRFIDGIFATTDGNMFLDSLMRFLPPVVRLGAINGLAQVTLKATVPGVPDFYQGSELWDFSLVDPDNRRPVDFGLREAALRSVAAMTLDSAKEHWRDGTLKLWLTHRLLGLRRRVPSLFLDGSYEPLTVEGPARDHLLAFRRRHEREEIIVVVARHLSRTAAGHRPGFWPDGSIFLESRLPAGERPLTELFSGTAFAPGCLDLRGVLGQLPVAVLGTGAT